MPASRDNNFIYMLIALVVFLVILPIIEDFGMLDAAWGQAISYTCLLAIGVWSLRGSNRVFKVAIAIAAIGIAMNILAVSPTEGDYVYGSILTLFLFLLLSIWASFRQIVLSNEISVNRLIGAICIYLLLGTIWAIAYTTVEIVSPGSFNGIELSGDSGWDSRWIYFSFVTLTTLGYGEITPASNAARTLAFAEAICGVFYLAVMVAGLVGAYMAERQKSG